MMSDEQMIHCTQRVVALARYFEQLTPASLAELPNWYAANAAFKDPFNEVKGVTEIRRVFEHMYVKLDRPRFVVHQHVVEGSQAFLVWDFLFSFKGEIAQQTVRGASHLQFDASGLICLHRDYWDAAEELYEKLPLIGKLMRWLKRRASS
jgi:steroid Delta-isomerase